MSGGMLTITSCFANANNEAGFFLQGTACQITDGRCCGNKNGAWSSSGAPCACYIINSYYNDSSGLISSDHGNIGVARKPNSGAAYGGFSQYNKVWDIYLFRLASIIRTDTAAFVYSTSNITPNTLSADGCYFVP
jgi:hypothetical protein